MRFPRAFNQLLLFATLGVIACRGPAETSAVEVPPPVVVPDPVVEPPPWNPEGSLALETPLWAAGAIQFKGIQYLIGGFDDDFAPRGATLRTRMDPDRPVDGQLLPWRESGDLEVPRAFVAVAIHRVGIGDTFLYAVGGRSPPFQLSAAVEAGRIQPDGAVDWSAAPEIAGSPLPSGQARVTAAISAGQFLYALGGFVRDAGSFVDHPSGDVLVTRINPDGTLPRDTVGDGWTVPAWHLAGTMPPGLSSNERAGAAVLVVDGFLFVIGGIGYDELHSPAFTTLSSVYRMKLGEDGSLDCPDACNWVRMPDLTDASGAPMGVANGSAFFRNGRLYYLGGVGDIPSVVLMAKLVPDDQNSPVPASWTQLPSFDRPPVREGAVDRVAASAFSLGSFLYVTGGLGNNGATDGIHARGDSLSAHLAPDGSIGR